jgi:hypothetical protein
MVSKNRWFNFMSLLAKLKSYFGRFCECAQILGFFSHSTFRFFLLLFLK